MTAIAQTPVLPEATLVGALSAQLRRPGSRSARSAKRRSAPFDRSRPTSAQGQAEKHAGLDSVGRDRDRCGRSRRASGRLASADTSSSSRGGASRPFRSRPFAELPDVGVGGLAEYHMRFGDSASNSAWATGRISPATTSRPNSAKVVRLFCFANVFSHQARSSTLI